MPITSEAERLAAAYIAYFWAADHDIKWLSLETELSLWLNANTLLVGRIDGIGETADGRPFFKEDKTASKWKAAKIKEEKIRWKMAPQALTYGVLLGTPGRGFNSRPYTNSSEMEPILVEPVRTFTTRWTFKTDPATCDFEWYTYSEDEIDWWQLELERIAEQIRMLRRGIIAGGHVLGQWPTNLNYCTRYGEKYACAFRDGGCHALNFGFVPDRMKPRTESHLQIENDLRTTQRNDDLVVLDATRVNDWINCHELYRRMWEGEGLREESEALETGGDFHALIDAHLKSIQSKQGSKL